MTKLLTLSQVEIQNIARAVHPLLEGVLDVEMIQIDLGREYGLFSKSPAVLRAIPFIRAARRRHLSINQTSERSKRN
jgi:hypothetical protein